MNKEIEQIFNTNKKVLELETETCRYMESDGTIEEINAYEESGEMAPILWFCINFTDGTQRRVNSKYVISLVLK